MSLAKSFAACQSKLLTNFFTGSSSVASNKSSGSSTASIFSKTSSESSCSTASSVVEEDWSYARLIRSRTAFLLVSIGSI